MRPKQSPKADHDDLFRSRLDHIINMRHPLVLLAERIDWAWIEEHLTDRFADNGRPAEPVRFMIGMFVLKHTYTLSDEQLWERWEHDPYFQYFTGEEFFQHGLPHERSGLSRERGHCTLFGGTDALGSAHASHHKRRRHGLSRHHLRQRHGEGIPRR